MILFWWVGTCVIVYRHSNSKNLSQHIVEWAFRLLPPPFPPPFAVYFSPLPFSLFLFIQKYVPPPSSLYLSCFFSASPSLSTSSLHTLYSCSLPSPYFYQSQSPKTLLPSTVCPATIKWLPPVFCIFEVFHPSFSLPTCISLYKLPSCLPLCATLYPPPLPLLTSLLPLWAQLLSSWAHSDVSVRVDWPESASRTPLSLFDPKPLSVSACVSFLSFSPLLQQFISVRPSG